VDGIGRSKIRSGAQGSGEFQNVLAQPQYSSSKAVKEAVVFLEQPGVSRAYW
jgi:hypothetical protein